MQGARLEGSSSCFIGLRGGLAGNLSVNKENASLGFLLVLRRQNQEFAE